MTTRHTTHPTVLGELTLVATDDAITGVYFPHHWYSPDSATFGLAVHAEQDELLLQALTEIVEYLAGSRRSFDVAYRATGEGIQTLVWDLVAEIGYGEVRTYGELAAALTERHGGDLPGTAVDAPLAKVVGQAVGRNPLCLIVPCHRVVGAGGRITGYAGGIHRKQHLLALEEPAAVTTGRLF